MKKVWDWVKFGASQAYLGVRWVYGQWRKMYEWRKEPAIVVAILFALLVFGLALSAFTGCASSPDAPAPIEEPSCDAGF